MANHKTVLTKTTIYPHEARVYWLEKMIPSINHAQQFLLNYTILIMVDKFYITEDVTLDPNEAAKVYDFRVALLVRNGWVKQ